MSGIAVIITQGQRIFESESGLPVFTLDATTDETHALTATVTEHPIAEAADVNDHAHQRPDSLRITGVITNTPVTGDGAPDAQRVSNTFALIRQMIKNSTVCKIVTPLHVYDSMICTSVGVSRTGPQLAITPTMEFREIRKVSLQTVPISASITKSKSAISKDDKDQQAKREADEAAKRKANENKTYAKRALEALAQIQVGSVAL